MDVINEDEELNYIDDGTPMETSENECPALKTIEAKANPATDEGQNSGLEPHVQLIWIHLRLRDPQQTSPDRRH
jgi:hypothetical protein